jgi:putative oxidoreductase
VSSTPSPLTASRPRALGEDLGLVLHRAVTGGFLLPHGLAESLGWFGGPGLTGFAAQLQRWGLPADAPIPFALAALQIILGVLLVLGAGTRISALLATLLLLVIAMVHAQEGWFQGLEYPVFWCAMLLVVALSGGGRFSVDGWLWVKGLRLNGNGNGHDHGNGD